MVLRGAAHHAFENVGQISLGVDAMQFCRVEKLFCYEAGPGGYGLYRQLIGLGHECVVVSPSLIPMKPGDKVKTDRRDVALTVALEKRASELAAPNPLADRIVQLWSPIAATATES